MKLKIGNVYKYNGATVLFTHKKLDYSGKVRARGYVMISGGGWLSAFPGHAGDTFFCLPLDGEGTEDLGRPELATEVDGFNVVVWKGRLYTGCTEHTKRQTLALFKKLGTALGYEVS